LDLLARLARQSLVVALPEADGVVPRFTMLETIRAFARERLAAAGELAAAQDAHAAYFLAAATPIGPQRPQAPPRSRTTRQWATTEQANIRAALAHFMATDQAEAVLRLAGATAWHVQTTPREGRDWIDWALARTPAGATVARGVALAELATMRWAQGAYAQARPVAEASLAIGRQLQDPEVLAHACFILGTIASSQADPAGGRACPRPRGGGATGRRRDARAVSGDRQSGWRGDGARPAGTTGRRPGR
jgi:hypothetical protein